MKLSNIKGSVTAVFKEPKPTTTVRAVISDVAIYLNQNGSLDVLTADFGPKKPGTAGSETLSLTPE